MSFYHLSGFSFSQSFPNFQIISGEVGFILLSPYSCTEVDGDGIWKSLGSQAESKGSEEEGQVQGGSAQGRGD